MTSAASSSSACALGSCSAGVTGMLPRRRSGADVGDVVVVTAMAMAGRERKRKNKKKKEKGRGLWGLGSSSREGSDDGPARQWRAENWAVAGFERYLLGWDVWYERTFLQRAGDPKAAAMRAAAAEYDFYTVLKEYWLLGLLGVDPSCQRRGIGQKIVEHGLKIAAEEKVPVTLEASVMGRGLYQKMGFKTIQTASYGEGVDGSARGLAMLWEPPALQGEWLEEGPDGTAKLKISR